MQEPELVWPVCAAGARCPVDYGPEGHVHMQIVGAKACNLCIVSGGCSRPANLSTDITAVREEWLLKGAEKYKLESESVHAVK